jgi:TolB-like protein/DNA-binding winged helix-turn-helix (wHTH) protein
MGSVQHYLAHSYTRPSGVGPRDLPTCNEIQIQGRQLWVDGRQINLGARAFDVLNLLVRHPDRVVTKKELLEAAWPGLVVEENNLQVQISNLRRVLGHDAITTIPAQGYQINVPLRLDADSRNGFEDPITLSRFDPESERPALVQPAPPEITQTFANSGRLPAIFAVLAAIALVGGASYLRWSASAPHAQEASSAGLRPAAAVDHSVAVLPFTDMSEKKDLEYFSEGLSEEVLHLLSRVPEMRVAARTSSFSFKDKSEDLPTIARKLQVANVLEGSVRRSGNSVRITAQLVRADSGFHLWSQTYDRKLGDIFQIQEEIAASVVQALQLSMMGERQADSMDTKRMEAYTLYLQGRSLQMHASTRADWENVDEYARRAVSADVGFAPAWAFFGRVLADRAQLGYIPGENGWEAARQAATRSLSLDPNLREGQLVIASIALRYDWNWDAAREQIDAVLLQDPGNALAMSWAGFLALVRGQKDHAIAYYEHATAIDPLDPNKYVQFAQALYLDGRYADAQIILHKALALDGGQAFAHWLLAKIALANGDPPAALSELEREPYEPARLAGQAIALHALGRGQESDAALAELERKFAANSPFHVATVYVDRGNIDRAMDELERAFQMRETNCILVNVDPLLAGVRASRRFAPFAQKMKLADARP